MYSILHITEVFNFHRTMHMMCWKITFAMLMSAMGKKFKCRMARYDMDANFILHSIIGVFLVGDRIGGGYAFLKRVLLLQNIEKPSI